MRSKSHEFTLIVMVLFLSTLLSAFSLRDDLVQNKNVKEPNVSGHFYPSNPKKLSILIDKMFSEVKTVKHFSHIYGLIAPHAGYIYSGSIAACAYKAVYGKNYSTVIILAPSHYHMLNKAAVYKSGFFKTPLGFVPVARFFVRIRTRSSGININQIVALNFITGPTHIVGSNGINPIAPITEVSTPVRNPNKKYAVIQIMETGSKYAINHKGTRGISGTI